MKFVIAVLASATSAIRVRDAPPFFNEPSWRETFPSAAGLVQQRTRAYDAPPFFNEPSWRETFPSAAGLMQQRTRAYDAPPFYNEPSWRETFPSAAGLMQQRNRAYDAPPFFNEPSWRETFPSGAGLMQHDQNRPLNADDTEPVGKQYEALAQAEPAQNPAGPIGGGAGNYAVTSKIVFNNKGYSAPEKVLQMDPKIARTHTTFYAQAEPQAAPAKAENPAGPIGGGAGNYAVTSKIVYNNKGYAAPEKVLQMDPKIARTHTTFYAQADPEAAPAKEGEKDAKKEKDTLGPIGGGGENYKFTKAIKYNIEGFPKPEKVMVEDPKIDRTHTTFYAQAEPEAAPAKEGAKDAKQDKDPRGPVGGGGANYAFTSKIKYNIKGFPKPEKVMVEDPKIDRTHTTFYAQN